MNFDLDLQNNDVHNQEPMLSEDGGGEGGGEGGGGGGEGSEGEEEMEKEKQDVFEMFQLVVVNSYGTQEVKKLPKDDTQLRLSSEEGREGGREGEGKREGGRKGGSEGES